MPGTGVVVPDDSRGRGAARVLPGGPEIFRGCAPDAQQLGIGEDRHHRPGITVAGENGPGFSDRAVNAFAAPDIAERIPRHRIVGDPPGDSALGIVADDDPVPPHRPARAVRGRVHGVEVFPGAGIGPRPVPPLEIEPDASAPHPLKDVQVGPDPGDRPLGRAGQAHPVRRHPDEESSAVAAGDDGFALRCEGTAHHRTVADEGRNLPIDPVVMGDRRPGFVNRGVEADREPVHGAEGVEVVGEGPGYGAHGALGQRGHIHGLHLPGAPVEVPEKIGIPSHPDVAVVRAPDCVEVQFGTAADLGPARTLKAGYPAVSAHGPGRIGGSSPDRPEIGVGRGSLPDPIRPVIAQDRAAVAHRPAGSGRGAPHSVEVGAGRGKHPPPRRFGVQDTRGESRRGGPDQTALLHETLPVTYIYLTAGPEIYSLFSPGPGRFRLGDGPRGILGKTVRSFRRRAREYPRARERPAGNGWSREPGRNRSRAPRPRPSSG